MMLISSVIRDSFQEYEGKQSLVLFCRGCNLKCPGCYNYGVVTKTTIGESKDLIPSLLTPLHDAVVFLGGEPTLYGEELIRNCHLVKERQLSVKVYTNGLMPHVLKDLLEVCDSFSIDLKAVSNCAKVVGIPITDEQYVGTVSESIDAVQKKDFEIRTTAFLEMSEAEVAAVKTYVSEKWPKARHIIQKDFRTHLPRNNH